MMISQTNPKVGYLAHQAEYDAAIRRMLDSGWYILGKEVEGFEAEFAAYNGVGHAIGVASGTDAVELALRACGVGVGDVVITVSHTAVATVAAIERCGATPALVDIDPATFTLDPAALERAVMKLGPRVKAIVPVHLYGHSADMNAIMDVARRRGLRVIEDCAQAHGAELRERKVGTFGDAAAFSFYPTKNLGALGDGGAIVTRDAAIADNVRVLREYGWKERYISAVPGVNSRLDEMQAAILRVGLTHLDESNARRRAIAARYDALIDAPNVELPAAPRRGVHVYHQYVIRVPQRDALKAKLREHGVGTLIHYPVPVHEQPAYANRLIDAGPLPHTERAARAVLSLPMFPQLTDAEVERVAASVNRLAGIADNTRTGAACAC